jgi:hypothetical protein
MNVDYFRIKIQQVKDEKDRVKLSQYAYDYYPDVYIRIHETMSTGRGREGTPIEFDIKCSNKGIFVLKKLVERFDPWIVIEGVQRYDRADMPEELFKDSEEGGPGRNWSEYAGERIEALDWP